MSVVAVADRLATVLTPPVRVSGFIEFMFAFLRTKKPISTFPIPTGWNRVAAALSSAVFLIGSNPYVPLISDVRGTAFCSRRLRFINARSF
jgi:hypothetical protein